jgi:hypothetical protein
MSNSRVDRWQHLVTGAFLLDEAGADRIAAETRVYLDSVLTVFPAGIDPVDDFEGYAVRRMASTLLRALETNAGRGSAAP